ncbi:MAG TPA: acyl-CoA dehydrogenase [Deltaproteobacteria bacterium]|nr:acyl-CoA dehydrogenase [Deltaproteobacteria bacterium]HPR54987.1 acyl-CoA dehydrogenase [Deltaproteobacteria bacterium]HXK46325.1 acyl-CoA dehydrogenase [Deltaproteobacteria bacterium]
MASMILDERDQQFVLYEMLEAERVCGNEKFADFSKETFNMILTEAQKIAEEEILPTLVESDRQGCRLVDGQVHVPDCFKRVYRLFCEGGWIGMSFPPEEGGQGMPESVKIAAIEWFYHNFAFIAYPFATEGAAHLILTYGTDEQKKKYMEKMVQGVWGGTMALTEPGAGSDVGNLSTKAIRQPDGTFKLQGTKIFITGGDHDLVENVIHPVLARIEGDPAGTKGISIFIVPKYLVNGDGTLGKRNDYEIAKIEEKMGIHGSATCLINFGDNNDCYAELLGNERDGMKIMFQMMNEARLAVGMQGLASASIAYLHALKYAKERLQGSSIMEMKNPEAPRVPIIRHPDVRRMLLWMKSNVDSMRALTYFVALCFDMHRIGVNEEEKDKWIGYAEMLTPIVKAYCSDIGFRVTENAMQIYGGYGFCSEYPVEQFMRDEKIASIYEGANGIQALDLIGRKLGMKKGTYFMNLLGLMGSTVTKYKEIEGLKELGDAVQASVNVLADTAVYFASCGKAGKFLVPINNAYPFLMMMGKVVSGWFLFWQAGIAKEKLDVLVRQAGIKGLDSAAMSDLAKSSKDVAFYMGKISSAQYFIRNVLPEVDAVVKAMKNEDMSIVEIPEESFA